VKKSNDQAFVRIRRGVFYAVLFVALSSGGCSPAPRIEVTGVVPVTDAAFSIDGDAAGEDAGVSCIPVPDQGRTGAVCTGTDGAGQSEEPGQPGMAVNSAVSEDQEGRAQEQIAVYVCGAVRNPGVYYLDSGSRICDALEAAGGFDDSADMSWLNQARVLQDGEMLSVCTKDEADALRAQGLIPMTLQDAAAVNNVTGSGDKVNLNTGSKEELMSLPGIGEAKADAIIRYRTETGWFASAEDVMNISGIKNSIYEKIRDRITV
jgi:competence protein ComEA